MNRKHINDVAYEYIRDITGLDGKNQISRCMNCGKPFNYTVLDEKKAKTSIIKRKEPVHWNFYKGFYLCDSCKEDKQECPENKFIYLRRKIRIEGISPKNYIKVMDKYIKPNKEE